MATAKVEMLRDAIRAVWTPVYALEKATKSQHRTDADWQALGDARRRARADTSSILRRNVVVTAADLNPPTVKCIAQMTTDERIIALGGKVIKRPIKPAAVNLTKKDLEPPVVRCVATMSDKQRLQELDRLCKSWTMGHTPLMDSDRWTDITSAEGDDIPANELNPDHWSKVVSQTA